MSLDLESLGAQAQDLPGVGPPLAHVEMHIDGDYAAYYFSGKDETLIGDARRNAINAFENAATWAQAGGRRIIHLTSGGSDKGGRFDIATTKAYQGQRDGSRRPKNWEAMRLWLEAGNIPGWKIKLWDDREADDGVAASAAYALTIGNVAGIFARDKDFRMIPGVHVDWTTFDIYRVQPDTWFMDTGKEDSYGRVIYGGWFFWYQMLAGDTADNIPGLEKGPAKQLGTFKACGAGCAMEHLGGVKTVEDAYAIVKGLYQAYYGPTWAERFVEQAALLWLRTDVKADIGDFRKAVPAKDPAIEQALLKLRRRINQ